MHYFSHASIFSIIIVYIHQPDMATLEYYHAILEENVNLQVNRLTLAVLALACFVYMSHCLDKLPTNAVLPLSVKAIVYM